MRGVVVALGNFDGVHLGHHSVLRRAVEEAGKRGSKVVAATFDPHPGWVLRPGKQPKLLTTLDIRREALLRCGAGEVRAIQFDKALSEKNPEEFVREVLLEKLEAEVVVVGENFRFGHKAAGDVEELRRLMRAHGGEVFAVALQQGEQEEVNSTRIRALISTGEVDRAAELLGRPYVLRGEVVAGDRRGRTIGFPTANVLPNPDVVVPAHGVYAGYVDVGDERYAACTNIGVAPTFARAESRVEAYLLDFDGDLYGSVIDVGFLRRIRPEQKFSGIEELKTQISSDVEKARLVYGSYIAHSS